MGGFCRFLYMYFLQILDSEGKVHHDLHNRDPSYIKYKYSYASEEQCKYNATAP